MNRTISVRDEIFDKLAFRKHPGQSMSGVIEGLIDDVARLQEQLRDCKTGYQYAGKR